MSLWWTKKEQLDKSQVALIENIPLRKSALVLGPPGSGKTNVLLRRAQFVRGQNMPNVLVLTFTRTLTEFVKTGCFDSQGREIFPQSCVTTLESWQRRLYVEHQTELPERTGPDLTLWKRQLSAGALALVPDRRKPMYDALFVDECQDLLDEEVALLARWAPVLFLVGDDRQKIYGHNEGLNSVRKQVKKLAEHRLRFHYRVAPEICEVADRVLRPDGGDSLASTSHYSGPKPGIVEVASSRLTREDQLAQTAQRLRDQIRLYADFIAQGDRIGVVVATTADRSRVLEYLDADPALNGKVKIIRAKQNEDDDYDPSFDAKVPICILTVHGCKGLEFRTVHWLFADENRHLHGPEHYYTVITRAKTRLDISYTESLPEILARAHAPQGVPEW